MNPLQKTWPVPISANLDSLTRILERQPDRRRLGRRILGVGICLVAVTITCAVLSIWHLRTGAIEDAEADALAIGTVLAEQTRRHVQVYDLIQRNLETRVRTEGYHSIDELRDDWRSEETHQLLRELMTFVPGRGGIMLIDSQGTQLNTSRDWPAKPFSIADREHFRFHQQTDSDDLHIMLRSRSDVTGKAVIYLSRRISSPSGAFLGIVVGAIDVPELQEFYHTLSLHEARAITLLRADGLILAADTRHEHRIGQTVPRGSNWHAASSAPTGRLYRGLHFLTGTPAIASTHPVPGLSLVLDIAREEDDILASWRQQMRLIVAGQVVVIAATVLFLLLIRRQFRMQDEQLSILRELGAEAVENARRLHDFASLASDWFWEQDADLRFVPIATPVPSTRLMGDTSNFGRRRQEQSGVDPDSPLWTLHEADLVARRPFRDFRYPRIAHDGTRHYVSISGMPIFGPDGGFQGYRGVGRDITQDMEAAETLRLAKERAEAAVVARAEFLANMSHELRTPLNVIIGFSDLIVRHPVAIANPPLGDYARDIHASGQDLLGTINAILDLSKLEDGLYQLRRDSVRVGPVLEARVREAQAAAQAKDIRLEYLDPGFEAVLCCDGRAFGQITGHVVNNAVKFTPAGGSVSVSMERLADGGLGVRVTDTGIGIDSAELARLFEPFYQSNSSLSRTHGGPGLGLAISHRLMTLHGGSIAVESTPGQGTTIRLLFPADRVMQGG